MSLATTETASVASATTEQRFCGSSSRNRVKERRRNVARLQKRQKQRPAASQERSVAQTAAETASGSVTGAFCDSNSNRNNVWERRRNVLWLQRQLNQRPGASHEAHKRLQGIASRPGQQQGRYKSVTVASQWPWSATVVPAAAGARTPEAPKPRSPEDHFLWGVYMYLFNVHLKNNKV